jgi:predicted kinase
MGQTLFIVRGLPGSGKSFLVQNKNALSTDQFFTNRGQYSFDPARIIEAYQFVLNQVRIKMSSKEDVYIEDSFTQHWEIYPFYKLAIQNDYTLEIMEPKTLWWLDRNVDELAARNSHNVSRKTIERMLSRWETIHGRKISNLPRNVTFIIRGLPGSGKEMFKDNLMKMFDWTESNHIPIIIGVYPTKKSLLDIVTKALHIGHRVVILEPASESWRNRNLKQMTENSGLSMNELESLAAQWESVSLDSILALQS